MLNDWEKRFPGRIETLFRSLANVVPSHLMDARLFDFAHLAASGEPDPDGDKAFDEDMPAATGAALTATISRSKV
jgi:tRNA 2-thiocytidine biosynthesis protein TtcA